MSGNEKIKVAFISLGCQKNLIDSEVMIKKLSDAGIEIVEEDINADVVVVNTCGFIESAKTEAIETILDVAWLKENRNLKGIVAAGCLVQRYADTILDEIPEIDAIVGVGNLDSIVEAVRHAYAKGMKKVDCPYRSVSAPEDQPLGGDRAVSTPEYTAYIKISEGCDNRCTYCAIPSIRGKFRSRPIEDLVKEAKELAEMGVKELIVISQDTTRYGRDLYDESKLPELLREFCKIDGFKWIRVLYCYPEEITDELIDVFANEEKIVKYLEMPIQHISDNVLRRMNRRGGREAVESAVKRLRERVPGIALRTTVIVGFPGETGDDFAELAEYLKETRFERLGAFKYSEEEGTPAASFGGKISEEKKERRYDAVMSNQMTIHEQFNKKQIGKVLEILCEDYDKVSECYYGRSIYDTPEIDGKVYFSAERKVRPGEFVNVRITDVVDYDLVGELAEA